VNPWDIFVHILSWVGLMIAIFGVFVLAWAIMEGLWKGLSGIIRKHNDDLDKYISEARALADKYRDDTAPEFREGFLAGSRWGWGYFHRLRKPRS